MADALIVTVLIYGHVLSAIGWLGGALLFVSALSPGLRTLSPGSNAEFTVKVLPRIMRYVQAAIGLTLLFGLLALYFMFATDFGMLSTTAQGLDIEVGAGLGLLTAALANVLTFPAFRKIIGFTKEMLKGGPQTAPPDMQKYIKRARYGSIAASVLLLIVLAFMVAAASF
jgi:uncharacterized membrane protein